MKIHSEEKRFRFNWNRFLWKSNLDGQRLWIGEKPYSCSFCGARFAQSSNMKLNLRVHTGEKPFTFSVWKAKKPFSCCVCVKTFGDSSDLRHLIGLTGEPVQVQCCDRQLTRREELKEAALPLVSSSVVWVVEVTKRNWWKCIRIVNYRG